VRSRRLTRLAGALVRVVTLSALAVVSGLAIFPGLARAADDQAAIEKITKLNKKAIDEYQNLNFDEARKLLKDALELAASSGLEAHPVAARTHVHMGVVLLAGFKQKDAALKEFDKALELQGDIKLNKALATPEIQEVYDEAVAARSAPPKTPLAPGEGITHEPVTQSPQGKAILIKAEVASAVGAKKVVLSYSADGADDFGEKDMKEDPEGSGTWVAEIPASAAQGAVVDYFIEAFGDDEEKTLASKGSASKAMHVAMTGPNGQILGRKPKKPVKPAQPSEGEGPTLFLGLGVGTGFGWASGAGEINPDAVVDPAGIAMSKLVHFAPEVGYFVSPELMLSVQARFQYISGATPFYGGDCSGGVCEPGNYALAGFGRATYFLSEGDLRPYVAGSLGFGRIRHVTEFKSRVDCGMPPNLVTCVDTVPSGPVYVGGGGGILYQLSPEFVLTLGANALVGFTRFTAHLDVNLGLGYQF
jgi:hypothetical protein